jgi:hypothetical protein
VRPRSCGWPPRQQRQEPESADRATELSTCLPASLRQAANASDQTLEIAQAADLVVIPSGHTVDDLHPGVVLAHSLRKKGVNSEKIAFAMFRTTGSDREDLADADAFAAELFKGLAARRIRPGFFSSSLLQSSWPEIHLYNSSLQPIRLPFGRFTATFRAAFGYVSGGFALPFGRFALDPLHNLEFTGSNRYRCARTASPEG